MRKNIKKKPAIVSAAVIIGFLALYLAGILILATGEPKDTVFLWCFLGVFSAVILAVIVGVLLALRQRLKEIDGGEEDAAQKY